MTKAADLTSPAPARIEAALLEYFDAPGKYPIGSRQPAVLFNAIYEVLQIAAGRTPSTCGPAPEGLRDAAAFFVGAALLYPGADHYTLLGLPAGSEPIRLKERYRLLMRLIHPDFSHSVRANWPNDSAMRVNRAYEILSSPVLRRDYDEQLSSAGLHHRSAMAHANRRTGAAPNRVPKVPRPRISKGAAWACILLLSLVAIAMLLPHREPARIVQKPKPAIADIGKTMLPAPREWRTISQFQDAAGATTGEAVPLTTVPGPTLAEIPSPAHIAVQVLQNDAAPVRSPAPMPSVSIASVPPISRPMEMPIAAGEGTRPAPASPATGVQAAPAAALAISAEAMAAPLRVVAIRPRPAPTMTEAQPLLNQLLQSLESGHPERLLHLLEPEGRQKAGAQAFSRQYQRLVGQGRQVTLSHAEFKGEPQGGVLIVTGNVRLQIGESTIGSLGEKLLLRAEFESRGEGITLTGLSGVPE